MFIQDQTIAWADMGASNVGPVQLRSNSVYGTHILDGEVNSADIADGRVLNADLGADSVNSAKVANNTLVPEDLTVAPYAELLNGSTFGSEMSTSLGQEKCATWASATAIQGGMAWAGGGTQPGIVVNRAGTFLVTAQVGDFPSDPDLIEINVLVRRGISTLAPLAVYQTLGGAGESRTVSLATTYRAAAGDRIQVCGYPKLGENATFFARKLTAAFLGR